MYLAKQIAQINIFERKRNMKKQEKKSYILQVKDGFGGWHNLQLAKKRQWEFFKLSTKEEANFRIKEIK
jgi:hypothetical protein